MGDYFKPWRRKIGMIPLVLACVFSAGWVRSQRIQDQIWVQQQQSLHVFVSMDGVVSWTRSSPFFLNIPVRWVSKDSTKMVRQNSWDGGDVHWHWQRGGFDFGAASFEEATSKGHAGPWTRRIEVWQVPFWSIVTPLTLLSAFLLLSWPRAKSPTTSP